MGLFDAFQGDRDEYDQKHKGHVTHDLIAGAATFEALKAYEEHCASQGKPDSHARAKEVAGALVAGLVTHLVETKGVDAWDSYKQKQAEEKAREQVEAVISEDY
ncbi:CipC1 protein [Boletus edulis]|uniref:CipC protein n=1 Tax=Boletus edulis BED1 TaxID=1328754 RepID=A0AAD4BT58_BOLED|nr:CipC1 protein [Boletus edulis]KAF8438951.1 hypothetical protein L210DRAFT_3504674 [Boletus edulis BED1]